MERKTDPRFKPYRQAYEQNRKVILATQDVCGICGQPVDKSLPYPDPMSATVDHIIPINRGGHPADLANLQLSHLRCNRAKSDRVPPPAGEQAEPKKEEKPFVWSTDWTRYKGKK